MRILIIILITINFSFGQTTSVSHKNFTSDEMKGVYSIVWLADKLSIIGENLRLKKRKRFEYEIFTGLVNNGWKEAEKVLTLGKYSLKSDTLRLVTKKSKHDPKSEKFGFKETYIVKKFVLTTKSSEKEKIYTFFCLVPFDKIDVFTTETNNLIKNLSAVVMRKFDNLDYQQFIGLNNEVEKIFWDKRIFLKKE